MPLILVVWLVEITDIDNRKKNTAALFTRDGDNSLHTESIFRNIGVKLGTFRRLRYT